MKAAIFVTKPVEDGEVPLTATLGRGDASRSLYARRERHIPAVPFRRSVSRAAREGACEITFCLISGSTTGTGFAMLPDDRNPYIIADGALILPLMVDGQMIRAAITLDAFTTLMKRAGLDPDDAFGTAFTDAVLRQLKPIIETHLQAKHMREGDAQPLVIDASDLTLH